MTRFFFNDLLNVIFDTKRLSEYIDCQGFAKVNVGVLSIFRQDCDMKFLNVCMRDVVGVLSIFRQDCDAFEISLLKFLKDVGVLSIFRQDCD